jgi:hypothetical protein
MANPLLIAGAAGSIFSSIASYKAAKSEAKGLKEQASILGMTAEELRSRGKVNASARLRQGSVEQGDIILGSSSRGAETANASTLGALQASAAKALEEANNITREAEFNAMVQEMEASSKLRASKAISKASKIGLVGSILGGSAQSYSAYKGQ